MDAGVLEVTELDESILDADPPCGRRGCLTIATWSAKASCLHPVRACDRHQREIASGQISGVLCRCGVGTLSSALVWVRI